MNKRKIEIVVSVATDSLDAKAGYTIYELTGFRVYTEVGADADLDVDDLGDEITTALTALDA